MAMAQSLPGPLDPTLPQDYKRLRLDTFDGGVNYAKQPERLGANELADVSNLFIYQGQLIVDTGYGLFGPQITGSPQKVYQAVWQDGTTQLFLLTTDAFYVQAPGPPAQWQHIHYSGRSTLASLFVASGQTSIGVVDPLVPIVGLPLNIQLASGQIQRTGNVTSIVGGTVAFTPALTANLNANGWVQPVIPLLLTASAINAGDTSITLVPPGAATLSAIGLAAGSRLGITLQNGQQWQATLSAVVGSTVTTTSPCPSPGALSGATVVIPLKLNGSLAIQPQMVTFAGLDKIIFSNGVDPLQIYTRIGFNLSQLPGLPAKTTCQSMAVFHESLHIVNLTDTFGSYPGRIRMSDATDPTGWTPGQNGIAALYDLVDTNDAILSVNELGPWLIVYREASIMRGTYLGRPLQTMFWEYMIVGEGISSQGCVAELGTQQPHFVIGTQNIYTYSGGYELIAIGDPIFNKLFFVRGMKNLSKKAVIFCLYVPENNEVLVFFASETEQYPMEALRYSLAAKAWYRRKFTDGFVSASSYSANVETWANAVGTWVTDTLPWSSHSTVLGASVMLLCAPLASQLFVYDYAARQDNGTVIPWQMVMKDIGDGDALQRWDSVVFYGEGNDVLVEYALDPPRDTDPAAPPVVYTPMMDADGAPLMLNFGSGVSRQRLTFNEVATYLRLRLSGADPAFSLSWAEIWYGFESEY